VEKDFDSWNVIKKKIDTTRKAPTFKEKEVWWCNIGLNIGDEENGKNDGFTRPVVIVKKFNKRIFLGIPLSTKIKDNKFYHTIHFKNIDQSAMLSQIRVLEGKRLSDKMGELLEIEFNKLKVKLKDVIFENISDPQEK